MRKRRLKKKAVSARRARVSAERAQPDEKESFGARLARLRKERGITQVELAQALGITQPVVSLYERDGVTVRGDQVVVLARLLRVSADELLGLKAERVRAGGGRDSRLARRIRELESLSRRDRDALLRTIDAFLSKAQPVEHRTA
jgi:transcriptional regulator with XRE-family HTH domain